MKVAVLFFIIFSTSFFVMEEAHALRSGYRIYKKVGKRYIHPKDKSSISFNTSRDKFKYISSRGAYRKVIHLNTGNIYYIHRKGVTGRDRRTGYRSTRIAKRAVAKPKNFSFNSLNQGLRPRFIVRATPRGEEVARTSDGGFKFTGKSRKGPKGSLWVEVQNSSDGTKGWVHQSGVTSNPKLMVDGSFNIPSLPSRNSDRSSDVQQGPLLGGGTPSMDEDDTSSGEVTGSNLNPTPEIPRDIGDRPARKKSNCQFSRRPRVQKSCESLCSFGKDTVRRKNCVKLHQMVASGKLPLKATLYSLKTWKETLGHYCDGNSISNKVRNKCSFMFSNLDASYKGRAYQSPAYMVDLCVGDSKRSGHRDVVNFTGTRRGTGTGTSRKKARYTDRKDIHTTLAGVFRTGVLRQFTPYKVNRKYRNIGYKRSDPNCKGKGTHGNKFLKKCKVIRLALHRIGGAASGGSKPMHTTPYNSSIGCPSLAPNKNWMMRKLAQGGVSLYIAYTSKASQAHLFKKPKARCEKDGDKHNPNMLGLTAGNTGFGI